VAGFDLGQHWQLSMGLFIVAVVIWLPQGLVGGLQKLSQRSKPGGHP
jgi:ABC-type branched-subunit amino acid transport system permease subunit